MGDFFEREAHTIIRWVLATAGEQNFVSPWAHFAGVEAKIRSRCEERFHTAAP